MPLAIASMAGGAALAPGAILIGAGSAALEPRVDVDVASAVNASAAGIVALVSGAAVVAARGAALEEQ